MFLLFWFIIGLLGALGFLVYTYIKEEKDITVFELAMSVVILLLGPSFIIVTFAYILIIENDTEDSPLKKVVIKRLK